ncbi:succinate dehydrogenase assembly factor 2 [Aurantimonas sp. Leaf443]|uniref:FAD assembly factor SdhE n=1 Tax=Aurantimonas sp. Leaf443 TaxID=1736378 RepID=UPI0006F7DFD0|nr:succinate dehydrogenase assembly factor 2 [Aurantimonas sp. Leaf443]KQT83492.1 hypothetical protein ASG48_13160 [Aurantimonas sp. Leaf443]
MTGTQRSSADLDIRRRKALYHSWHRGIREMDLVLGRFADAEIGTLTEDELSEFERLMDVPDPDLFKWMTGSLAVPDNYDTALFRRVQAFHGGAEELRGAQEPRP